MIYHDHCHPILHTKDQNPHQEANRNYEEYLAAIGTGPCSQDMVMRADMVMFINQDHDKQWRIANETLIKAKSIRGYRTNNRKWTENKFKVKCDNI